MPVITLTTDFGERDPYVAAMKGVILDINPDVRLVDLSHEITPHDVVEAALFVASAIPFFPKGTIHVVVVDPGVGTERRALALSAGGQIIVGPDNGFVSLYLRDHPLQGAYEIAHSASMRADVSATFHGRDIFAPVAADLSLGMHIQRIGQPVSELMMLDVDEPEVMDDTIVGEIIHVDRFGNLITNISRSLLGGRVIMSVQVAGERVAGVGRTYADAPPGMAIALFGSMGHLEIALNGASAEDALRLGMGDSVILKLA